MLHGAKTSLILNNRKEFIMKIIEKLRIETHFELCDIIIQRSNKILMMQIGSHVGCIEDIDEMDKMILFLTHCRNRIQDIKMSESEK